MRTASVFAALACACCFSAWAADKPAAAPSTSQTVPAQPTTESLDLATIARIRDEGFHHSHIMEYGSGLFDGIGPRLTGSPEFARAAQWSVLQLKNIGAANPHLESWGDFGMGWTQIGTSVLITAPSTGTILAQATPWSPATAGEVTAQVIEVPALTDEKDFDNWKGKLTGKIVLYGDPPRINIPTASPMEHYDPAKLDHFKSYPLDGDQSDSFVLPNDPALFEKAFQKMAFKEKVGRFLADEKAVAVLIPGGFGGVLHDDTNVSLGWYVYNPDHKQAIPSAVIASEAFGRIARLVSHDVPVSLKLNITTQFSGDHEAGNNVIADIPGADPALKDQVSHDGRSSR